jgi:hypothetical protein
MPDPTPTPTPEAARVPDGGAAYLPRVEMIEARDHARRLSAVATCRDTIRALQAIATAADVLADVAQTVDAARDAGHLCDTADLAAMLHDIASDVSGNADRQVAA